MKRTTTKPAPKTTTKTERFEDSNDTGELLASFLDALHGDAWRAAGNGTFNAKAGA